MENTQKELFMQFLVIFDDMQMRVKVISELIPVEEELKEREKLRMVTTMSGRKKMARSVTEEELVEVESILDNLDILLERLDQAAEIVDSMVAVA